MRPACRPRARLAAAALCLLLAACGAATSATRDDASIATLVKIALLNEPGVGERRLDARAASGVVTLSGTVTTQAEADRAIAAARRVHGVRDVKSELKIEPQISPTTHHH